MANLPASQMSIESLVYTPGNEPKRYQYLLGERQLWAETLGDALELAAGRGAKDTSKSGYLEQDQAIAKAWIRRNDWRVGGFLWICEILKLDAEKLREAMRRADRWRIWGLRETEEAYQRRKGRGWTPTR